MKDTLRHLHSLWIAPLCAIAAAFSITGLVAACSHEPWEDVPDNVSRFISTYYPSTEIESYTNRDGEQMVVIKNGPTFYFNASGAWTRIDGNGVPLSQMLVYDELPEPLYAYIEELEETAAVYVIERDGDEWRVALSDSTLTYTPGGGVVTVAGSIVND